MRRLTPQVVSRPPVDLKLSNYAPTASPYTGIVHLGVGAFHRAHQAVYTDTILAIEDGNWQITGASLRSDQVQQQLSPQNCLFTVVEKDNQKQRYRLVQSIARIIVAPHEPLQLIEAMAADACKIIGLTITEKGYCHNPATGKLNRQHPDIVHDLEHPSTPLSAPGFITAALLQRYHNNAQGVSILSCDNIPANGKLTRQLILEFASELDAGLATWIDEHVSFPCTMVDRIVPATTEADRINLEKVLGYRDDAMVCSEPFSQWIIEDDFAQGRPAWEKAGAVFVDDVHNFETMKLRLLNGSHSAMAYLGYLAGHDYIHQVVGDSVFLQFIRFLMDEEITPTLSVPAQIDLETYKCELLQRFANSALKHRTQQIAMDGSQKIPQRLLQAISHQIKHGGSIAALSLAVAGWIRYSRGIDESGTPYEILDPLSEKLHALYAESGATTDTLVRAILAVPEIFPRQLGENQAFYEKVNFYLGELNEHGSKLSVERFLEARKDQP
ncbi:MAG: mannitol dehydrogenase family protein [Halieaceae bacterium]|jgi:fructuronate reductase|nr:mannitol dehydrogenase family protein [Halieaceae bacterium]